MIETADNVKRRQGKLASAFRDLMTDGQSYQGTNDYRKKFYKRVTELAHKVSFREFPHFVDDDRFQKSSWKTANNLPVKTRTNQSHSTPGLIETIME